MHVPYRLPIKIFEMYYKLCLNFVSSLTFLFANAFFFLLRKKAIVAQTGTIWASLLGLQSARFDKLEVYDYVTSSYADVATTLADLYARIGVVASADESRIEAIESKLTSLDEQKADKFEAVPPLVLDEGTFPNQLSQGGPTRAAASAVNFAGEDEYIQFDGRTDCLDFTKDWTVGFRSGRKALV